MQVDVTLEPALVLGTPKKLFSADEAGVLLQSNKGFDVSSDGQRFVMVQDVKQEGVAPSLVVVQKWLSEFQDR